MGRLGILAKTFATVANRLQSVFLPKSGRVSVSFGDQLNRPPIDGRIPSNIYQTGASRAVTPAQLEDMMRFREINDDMNFIFLDDEEMHTFMETFWSNDPVFSVFQKSVFPQMKADIFRYCIIYDQGGFYCDINKGIFTNLGSFCSDETGFVLSFESNECIVFPDMEVASLLQHPTKVVIQWAFGATSGHPILKSIIKEIPKIASFIEGVRVHNVKEAVLMTTGPGVFTRVVRQHIAAEGVADIRQVGVDFDGTGRHRLAGTKPSASAARAHYAKAGSRVIIR